MNIVSALLIVLSSAFFLQTDVDNCGPYEDVFDNIQALFQEEEYEQVLDLLNCAIELEPENTRALTLRVFTNLSLYQIEAALTDANSVIALTSVDDVWHITNLLLKADILTYLEDYEEATDIINNIVSMNDTITDSQLSIAYVQLGSIYIFRDDPLQAINYFTLAIELDSGSSLALYWRGIAHDMLEDFELAHADKSLAIELNPDISSDFAQIASIYFNLENYDLAVLYGGFAIESDGDGEFTWLYHAQRGLSYYYLEEYDKAVTDMTHVLDLYPNSDEARFFRGCSYVQLGENDLAIRDLSRIVERHPDFPDTYVCRGDAFYNNGDFDLALDDYTTYVSLVDNDEIAIDPRILDRILELSQ